MARETNEFGYTPTALEFSSVFYNEADVKSLVFAYMSLVPQALIVYYFTLAFATREIETCMLMAGQFVNELVNGWLKHQIKQERPRLGHGYGMPSGHSQFVFFFVTYNILTLATKRPYLSRSTKLVRSLGLLMLAHLVAFSRKYLHYHSTPQVVAGSALGVVTGLAWFLFVGLVRDLGIVDLVLDLGPSRWFYLKDSDNEHVSVLRDEYVDWRRRRMKMKLLIKDN